jgi:hypothetical protein
MVNKLWHFLNGLNHPIKKITDFQLYFNLLELVHQATKAERQVQEDYKYSKYSSKTYGSYTQASTTTTPPTTTRATPSTGDKSSSKQPITSLSHPTSRTSKPRTSSSTPPTDATTKTSAIQCLTCKG